MMSFQFGVERREPSNVIGIAEIFDWGTIDGVIVGSPCDSPQQAIEEAMNILHRLKPYKLEAWLDDRIECLERALTDKPDRADSTTLGEELSRYKALHRKVLKYRSLCTLCSFDPASHS